MSHDISDTKRIVLVMIGKVSPMQAALAQAVVGGVDNVCRFCRELGISRQTFYAYKARFELEGLDGLLPRSRRPRRSPGKSSEELEQSIVDYVSASRTTAWTMAPRRFGTPYASRA